MLENRSFINRNLFCYLYKNDEFKLDSIFHFIEHLKKQTINPQVLFSIS